jgi:hypothetical protein
LLKIIDIDNSDRLNNISQDADQNITKKAIKTKNKMNRMLKNLDVNNIIDKDKFMRENDLRDLLKGGK